MVPPKSEATPRPRPLPLREIADAVGAQIRGDAFALVDRVATLSEASPGAISFFANRRYRKHLSDTKATAVFVRAGDVEVCAATALIVEDPYLAFAKTAAMLNPLPEFTAGIAATAVVDPTAFIASTAYIGPFAVVGARCRVDDHAVIGPHCVLEHDSCVGAQTRLTAHAVLGHGVRFGKRGLVHAGTVLGSDGFGFASEGGRWVKVPQLGTVVVGDDVEIGANTTIDRGALNDTVIGDGVKLDNLIQVAHNVVIGNDTAIAGCVGIAGSAIIGQRCAIGGGAGILGHLTIADDVRITPMSLVTRSIKKAGTYSSGVPLQESVHWQRNFVRFKQLDRMAVRLQRLEQQRGIYAADQGSASGTSDGSREDEFRDE